MTLPLPLHFIISDCKHFEGLYRNQEQEYQHTRYSYFGSASYFFRQLLFATLMDSCMILAFDILASINTPCLYKHRARRILDLKRVGRVYLIEYRNIVSSRPHVRVGRRLFRLLLFTPLIDSASDNAFYYFRYLCIPCSHKHPSSGSFNRKRAKRTT